MAMVYRLRPTEVAPAKQANPPTVLPRAPKTPEVLIAMGAEIMAEYMDPSTDVTEAQVLAAMIELFDNPTAIEA